MRVDTNMGRVTVALESGRNMMNVDWHRSSVIYALQNVVPVATTEAVLGAWV